MSESEDKKVINLEKFRQRSELARDLSSLKRRIFKLIEKRENLPRPFFWSMFNSEIDALRKKRSKKEN